MNMGKKLTDLTEGTTISPESSYLVEMGDGTGTKHVKHKNLVTQFLSDMSMTYDQTMQVLEEIESDDSDDEGTKIPNIDAISDWIASKIADSLLTKVNFTDITRSSAVTKVGEKALDAIEKNASVEGTLANLIAQQNSNLSIQRINFEYLNGFSDQDQNWKTSIIRYGKVLVGLINCKCNTEITTSRIIMKFNINCIKDFWIPASKNWAENATWDCSICLFGNGDLSVYGKIPANASIHAFFVTLIN